MMFLRWPIYIAMGKEKTEKKYKWRRDDYREKTKGLLMVNTGDGKGKTTCALGLIMRAAGQGLNCCIIQFMKSKTDRYGEHESLEKLGVEVHTMGDGFTWDTNDKAQDISTSEKTWALCVEKLRSGDYDLLVFDELVYVLDYGFLDEQAVIDELNSIRAAQSALHIVVTGRNASDALIEAADLVSEIKEVKHPFNAGIFAQQGIEF
jgi:cob(I)alamin adenosyltransferase